MKHEVLFVPHLVSVLAMVKHHSAFGLDQQRRSPRQITTHDVFEVGVIFYVLAIFKLLAKLKHHLVVYYWMQQLRNRLQEIA